MAQQIEWKPVADFPNYRISNTGRIQTCRRGKGYTDWYDLKLRDNHKSGYVYAGLFQSPGVRVWFRLHRLVYSTFVGCIPDTLIVDHIDNNKQNNELKNLQLLTCSENSIKYHKTKNKIK